MKPVSLSAYPIKNSSVPNGIVLDLFGGSGSTLIACEQTDRVCPMMEFDPKYASVIIQRVINQVQKQRRCEGTAGRARFVDGGGHCLTSERGV